MTHTIRINRQDIIEKMIDEKVNELNATGRRGGWQVHVFPGRFKFEETEIMDVKPFFHQEGNFYGREVGHVCEFGISSFFNWDGQDMDARDLFLIEEGRQEARTQFKKENNLDEDFDLDNLNEEIKKKLETMENQYIENALTFTRETLSNNMKDSIDCEDGEGEILHSYKIEWI